MMVACWSGSANAALVSACALATAQGRPLPEALEALGAADPALGDQVRRLVPSLRRGEPLARALLRLGALGREEARHLAAAEAHGLAGPVLGVLAEARRWSGPGLGLWRWFPTWTVLALMCGVGCHHLLHAAGVPILALYDDLGLTLGWEMGLVTLSRPGDLAVKVLTAASLVTAVVGAQGLLTLHPLLDLLRVFSCPPLMRLILVRRLLIMGMLAEAGARSGRPQPRRAWRWALVVYRASLLLRRDGPLFRRLGLLVGRTPALPLHRQVDPGDLPAILMALGLVHRGAAGLEWRPALAEAEAGLRAVAQPVLGLLGLVLLCAGLWGFMAGICLPLMENIELLGCM